MSTDRYLDRVRDRIVLSSPHAHYFGTLQITRTLVPTSLLLVTEPIIPQPTQNALVLMSMVDVRVVRMSMIQSLVPMHMNMRFL